MKKIILFSLPVFILIACGQKQTVQEKKAIPIYETTAKQETTPVKSQQNQDAADDPAVWIHPDNPEESKIIGSNKKAGVVVYNLDGEELYFYPIGRVNNLDVCYNFDLNGQMVDLMGGSNRTYTAVSLMKINKETGELEDIAADTLFSNVNDVYGFCFYRNKENRTYYAFVNGKDGKVEQYEMKATNNNKVAFDLVRTFQLDSQVEGMVADYETNDLYIGQEDVGVWKYGANPEDGENRQFIAMSDSTNPNIQYDVEGITIYYAKDKQGYVLVSSQGNNSYAVFDRTGNNKYIGSFRVIDGTVDGIQETDGIDVNNLSFGEKFPNGLFIAQDGFNYDGEELTQQNFKLVDWKSIAQLFPENLIIDTKLDIRSLTK